MKKILLLLFSIPCIGFAQGQKIDKQEISINELLKGSLYTPSKATKKTDLVIIIAGSGMPDRDGNQQGMNNNSLRYFAEGLAKNDIAAFSFDKRTIAMKASGKLSEKDVLFDDFIGDVKTIITYFRDKKQFRRIIIAGHSEGSLIGMVAANGNADAFISLAGAGRTIDLVLEEQLTAAAPANLKAEIHDDLQLLKNGQAFEPKNPMLGSIFRESVQPYLISWMKYDPQTEIAKLKIPVLIINGTRDIQVPVSDAELLQRAKPDAKLSIIANMNHVFKEVKTDDRQENVATYSNADLPVVPELVSNVNQFIKSL
jgi:alpha/beta superfamily hydrolase